jgi:hypothetical protein
MTWFKNGKNNEPTPAQLHADFERMLSEAISFGRYNASLRLPDIANRLADAADSLRMVHATTAPSDSALY